MLMDSAVFLDVKLYFHCAPLSIRACEVSIYGIAAWEGSEYGLYEGWCEVDDWDRLIVGSQLLSIPYYNYKASHMELKEVEFFTIV